MARQRKRKGDPVHGWLCLDKPLDMTSTQAVGIVKRLFNAQKAGHGGTLDPLASGILPIALGAATKTVSWAMDADKDYLFTVHWGVSTASYDREGVETGRSDVRPTRDAIEALLPQFVGEIEQIPPRFSAIKVNGERAYDLARDGEDFELEPRPVTVYAADLVALSDEDHATFRVRSGKGFYVRAMARDLAQALGTEGHISELRRTRVGGFDQVNAVSIEALEAMADPQARRDALEPVEAPLDGLPKLDIGPDDSAQLRNGQAVMLLPHVVEHWRANRATGEDDRLGVAIEGDIAIAIGEVRAGRFQPVRLLSV